MNYWIKILLVAMFIFISAYPLFAFTCASSNYALRGVNTIVASGNCNSENYFLRQVRLGNVFAGRSRSPAYYLDAAGPKPQLTPRFPNPPQLLPVTSPTNIPYQVLRGKKDPGAAIFINGYLVVSGDTQASWEHQVDLNEGENYFIITARNQDGLESDSVQVVITFGSAVLSIVVWPDFWNISQVEAGSSLIMPEAEKIMVINNGDIATDFILKLINPQDWQAADYPAPEKFSLSGIFCAAEDNFPRAADFNQNGSEDIITIEEKKATAADFGFSAGGGSGENVPSGQRRALFLQFKAPARTKITDSQEIRLILNCEAARGD